MPIDRFEIGLGWRHLHIIFRRHIKGTVAADAEVDAGRLDQVFDLRLDRAWRRRRRRGCDLCRQAIALITVEDREALEKRNGLRFLTVLAGAALFLGRHKPIGVDHGGAALALADVTTERQRLAECEPALACKSVFGGRTPENQNVYAAILTAGRGAFRQGQRRLRRRGAPRLHPRYSASLQLEDDLVGDVVIKVCPVLTGARPMILSGHRGSPRRAPRASLAACNPSRQNRATL
ncbi:hypothetical protein ABIA00_007997 [Bradyrhizobium ottawaense]